MVCGLLLAMVRAVKREAVSTRSGRNDAAQSSNGNSNNDSSGEEDALALDRRVLRSRYLNVKSRICGNFLVFYCRIKLVLELDVIFNSLCIYFFMMMRVLYSSSKC